MGSEWPAGGAWLVVPTGADADWGTAVAALAAASAAPVAVVVLYAGDTPPSTDGTEADTVHFWRSRLVDVQVHLRRSPLVDVILMVRLLTRTHGLVLVAAPPGLFVGLNDDDETAMQLAGKLDLPVVVVTRHGADLVNHASLALGSTRAAGLPSTLVITDAPDGDPEPLPVTPAGRIPVAVPGRPEEFVRAAKEWLNPVLHAAGTTAETPPTAAQTATGQTATGQLATRAVRASTAVRTATGAVHAAGPPRLPSGRGSRLLLVLAGIFVAMILLVVAVAYVNSMTDDRDLTGSAAVQTGQVPTTVAGGPSGTANGVRGGCPGNPARPSRVRSTSTTTRVDAAWSRIDDWMSEHVRKDVGRRSPGATEGEIEDLQNRMSVTFPDDLVASLRRHNGTFLMDFELPGGLQPVSTHRIEFEWGWNCSLRDFPSKRELPYARDMVAFASTIGGKLLLVDGHGLIAQRRPRGVDYSVRPTTITATLEEAATALETGRRYQGRYRARVVGGRLTWKSG